MRCNNTFQVDSIHGPYALLVRTTPTLVIFNTIWEITYHSHLTSTVLLVGAAKGMTLLRATFGTPTVIYGNPSF